MGTTDRGLKHKCLKCEIKYYDLNREAVTCPKCGEPPIARKLPRSVQPLKKTRRAVFGRYL
jgi:hypothetical protein